MTDWGRCSAGPSANQKPTLVETLNQEEVWGTGGKLQIEVRLLAVLTCVASVAPSGAKNQPKEEKEKIMFKKAKNVEGSGQEKY